MQSKRPYATAAAAGPAADPRPRGAWSYNTKGEGVDRRPAHKYYDICNNCGKHGHTFKQCKNPITSYGVIVFRLVPNQERQYLMIRRKDTLGYVDFMRGKYSVSNQKYILNMLQQMTVQEKEKLRTRTFVDLWYDLWKEELVHTKDPPHAKDPLHVAIPEDDMMGDYVDPPDLLPMDPSAIDTETTRERTESQGEDTDDILPETPLSTGQVYSTYKQEEMNSREKFHYLATKSMEEVVNQSNLPAEYRSVVPGSGMTILQHLIACSSRGEGWTEPEWGFPKGRRNFQEKDYDCALREMTEETGYPAHLVKNIKNILPFDEIFLGSNYKSYKHKYYLMYMKYEDSLSMDRYDKSEVSMMKWKSYDECLASIRPYNLEKKRLITHIETTLTKYRIRGILYN